MLPAVIKLRVQNLMKLSDTGEPILSRMNLDIPSGLIVGVIGPSGSGKSTLLRALNRLWEPSSNTIFFDNQDICQLDVLSLRRRVGMLFQLPSLITGTIADNIQYGPRLRGKRLTDIELQKLLCMADLDLSRASKPASDLSVGQAQRVALSRSLANDPEVVLLDEPTSALDPISTRNIEKTMLLLKKSQRMTIVMVSDCVKQIQQIADLICLLDDGEVVEVLPP